MSRPGRYGTGSARPGWSATSVPDPTAARYAQVLAELAEHAAESLSRGSRVVAEELGPSLRWPTANTTTTTSSH